MQPIRDLANPAWHPPDRSAAEDLASIAEAISAAEQRLTRRGAEVPQWIVDGQVPIRYSTYKSQWCIQLQCKVRILEVVYSNWVHRPQSPKPVQVKFWLPLGKDGSYRLSQLHVENMDTQLPHVSAYMACLSLGDAPEKINSLETYDTLKASLKRGLSQINLSSLLNYEKAKWPKEVRLAIPAEVRRKIGRLRMNHLSQEVLDKYFSRTPSEIEEEETTWTTQTMATAPIEPPF